MSKKPRRQDLAKLGNQFVLVYAIGDAVTVMPIVEKPVNAPTHRLDVPIDEKELFCLKKPTGALHIRLQETKAVDPAKLSVIGKVSKASLGRIDTALARERQIRADEESRYQRRGVYRRLGQ